MRIALRGLWLALVVCLALGVAGAADPPTVTLNDESGVVVELGGIVNVCGTNDVQQISRTCLMVDRRAVSSKPGSGRYSLTWDTREAQLGEHFLEVAAVGPTGARKIIFRAQAKVVRDAPVRISVPSEVVSLGASQKITVNSIAGYSPTRARLIIDSAAGTPDMPVKNGAVEWDTSALPSGDHTLRLLTWDADNFVAGSAPVSVKVPSRLVVKAPDAVTVTQENPHIELAVEIPAGVEVARLTACCDGKAAVDVRSRCSDLKLPATELESGKHEISVELVDAGGTTHKWGPQSVSVDNQYKVAMAAKAEADKAAKEAAEKEEQAAFDRTVASMEAEKAAEAARKKAEDQQKQTNAETPGAGYRDAPKQTASSQDSSRAKLAQSGGTIGRTRGMCVVEVGGLVEFGEVFTITAEVTPGKGTVRVNASDVDGYFTESITKARKYIMNYIAKAGYKADWMKSHIELHYQCDGPKGGDSAGAAMATAILSSLLKVPVRNDVVITGAIEPDGTIMPVGGVDLKAAAAFQDKTVLTVIVPRFLDNVADVLTLPYKLLAGHRLVAAKDMSQVLRQALVGYDEGTLTSSCRLFGQGMELYDSGKVNEAIAKLREAATLTPEDLSIPVWIKVMKANQR